MSKGITYLRCRLSSFTLYRRAFVQAQKESIQDRASVHAKKGEFGPKKQSCDAPISKQETVTYRIGVHTLPDSFLCLHEKLFIIG